MKTVGLIALLAVGGSAVAQKLQVKIENRVPYFDALPMYRNRVAVVPIRSMIDAMDGTMKWNMGTQTVQCWANGKRFDIVLNSRQARVNDKTVSMEEGAFIYKGRIYVPLRFLADAAGYVVSEEGDWYVLKESKR